jgi:hypothetical protein
LVGFDHPYALIRLRAVCHKLSGMIPGYQGADLTRAGSIRLEGSLRRDRRNELVQPLLGPIRKLHIDEKRLVRAVVDCQDFLCGIAEQASEDSRLR